ncbi:DUF4139 domain-containing protein [Orbus sturtevantii]|uniref:DUF4139 domain-containing protein n=1 Tax=Orbus sturtevantii TaxID=3074109 RepID=UPI00370D934E
MKLNTIVPLLLLCSIPLISQYVLASEVVARVDLTKVTLFLKGAELHGSTVVNVPKGETEIVLTQLANTIDLNSINVGLDNKAMILSTSLIDDYIAEKSESDRLKQLRDSLKKLEDEREILNIKLTAINGEITLLQGNRIGNIIKSNGSLGDAKQVINFVKDNLTNALTEQLTVKSALKTLDGKITQYQLQIGQADGGDHKAEKAIKVKIYTPEATKLPISLSYVTPQAGWAPIYDVRVPNITGPLALTYKANVYQYTGLNWHNIDFTLSTANPTEGITAPLPKPWNIYLNEGKALYGAMAKSAVSPSYDSLSEQKDQILFKQSNSFADYVTTNSNGLNLQFTIQLPYTISGYSKDNVLTLKERNVSAEYRYIATPKLDSNAFLQAQINDWDKLELLPGKTTVFYAGNYIGEGFITTQGIEDKLNISLGRDNEIIISRNQDINETSKPSFFGNEISQKFAYTIDVRNTKNVPIDITIYDQLPVIQNKTITLDDAKYSGASYQKETGLLTWNINLQAKEAKQLPFSFKISYPKDKADSIIGL